MSQEVSQDVSQDVSKDVKNVPAGNGNATDRAGGPNGVIRDQTFPKIRPRDSATLILIDRSGSVPKVLLGRRHQRHRFLPGKFVFPGGRIEPADRRMTALMPLREPYVARLMTRVRRPSAAKAAGFALAALRETYEETGLMVGRRAEQPFTAPPGAWQAFAEAGIIPDLSTLHFIARAITPPQRPLRFDSRFFATEISSIAHRVEGLVGPDAELVEVVWLPITEARSLDMPGITAVVLEELADRIAGGMNPDHPVPLYRTLHQRFVREAL
jgi:8-oxo-dGTP pyrophosphatase MutT (NUDIX family)